MKRKLTENPIKKYARKMLKEGSVDTAEVVLACKDQVDSIQDFVEKLSKMLNDELPKLVDRIRSTFDEGKAVEYQGTVNGILSPLLDTVKQTKSDLEQTVLELTGEETSIGGPKTDLNLPEEPENEQPEELDLSKEEPEEHNPMGRERRLPAKESQEFKKKLAEAKIRSLKKALDQTDEKKFPARKRRLAEELNRVAIKTIKEEAEEQKGEEKFKCADCGVYVDNNKWCPKCGNTENFVKME
ncbi:Uncharacterised protein [uncultured archaeon]|nr:Uncharacterised protein [uncultured archaeon]